MIEILLILYTKDWGKVRHFSNSFLYLQLVKISMNCLQNQLYCQ